MDTAGRASHTQMYRDTEVDMCFLIHLHVDEICVRLTSTVLVAQVREPPHVPESYSKAHAGHDEIHLPRPGLALLVALSSFHGCLLVLSGTNPRRRVAGGPRLRQQDQAAIEGG